MARMGRPRKKVKDLRSKPVSLGVTPGDHKRLFNEAREQGMTVSDYLIWCWKEKAGEK